MARRKLVVVSNSGPLVELGGLCGPLTTPVHITMDAIHKMVLNGKKVFECNPACPGNEEMRVQLNLHNYDKDNFVVGKAKEEAPAPTPVEPPKEETLVAPPTPVSPEKESEPEFDPEQDDLDGTTPDEDDVVETPEVEDSTEEPKEEAPASQNNNQKQAGGKKNKHRH